MLFDVVLLRKEGRRQLRADVLRDVPIRGEVSTENTGARYGVVATLTLAGAVHWRLERVTVGRIASGSLVLAGVELADDMRQTQDWRYRLPSGGRLRPYDPEPPSTVARDPSYAPAKNPV